jgi:hypothetical protein
MATSSQALTATTSSKALTNATTRPKRVTGKLVHAIKRIIEHGDDLEQAGKASGLTTHAVRCALARPHVIAYMRERRHVFRAYLCASNEWHAARIREQTDNHTAAIQAIRILNELGDEHERKNAIRTPGITIQIIAAPSGKDVTSAPTINVTPMNATSGTPLVGERSGQDE